MTVTASVVAALISWSFAGESLAALGIPDPGPLTTAGLPFLRGTVWALVSFTVGSFLCSAFLIAPVPGQLSGAQLSLDGRLAARAGAYCALVIAVVSVMMVPLLLSDVSGQPLVEALRPANWAVAWGQVFETKIWLLTAGIALIVAVGGLVATSWRFQPVLLVFAIAIVAPLGLSGHSASGGDHDYGTNSLLWHLLFMMLWVGGLVGLIAHARRLGPNLAGAVQRYSRIALVAVVVLAISGVINATIRVRLEDLLSSDYGRMILVKSVLTLVLAAIGWMHRTWIIPRLAGETRARRAFIRLAVVEALIMAATMGVAVSLGRTPPPPPRVINLSPMNLQMGYDLTVEPTIWSVWTVWRLDLMFTTVAVVAAIAYARGLVLLRRKGIRWSKLRVMWFYLGIVTVAVGMSSGIGLYMPAMFSMHMVAHMMLSMVVPVFLVLGAPLTLVLAATEPAAPGQLPGPHEWVEALLASRALALIMVPAVNTIQYITIFYFIYVTPWYELMISEHAGHLIMNWVFLLSGYVYYWEMIGADPKPKNNKVIARLAWLIFSMPFHLFFGVYLMQLSTVLAGDFYQSLQLPWGVDVMHDQNVGGGIAWASGSFPLVVVFGTLFAQWLREDRADMKAYEDKAAVDDEEELRAYNAMLADMSKGGAPLRDQGEFSSPVEFN